MRGKPAMLNGAEYSFRLKDTLIPLEGPWKAKKGFSTKALLNLTILVGNLLCYIMV